jgi:hypothetical protein
MNCTDSTESDAALTELIVKYHAIGAYQIAQVGRDLSNYSILEAILVDV